MIVSKIIAAISRYMDYRKTVAELQSLDDRALNDLGIMRCDINTIARKAVTA